MLSRKLFAATDCRGYQRYLGEEPVFCFPNHSRYIILMQPILTRFGGISRLSFETFTATRTGILWGDALLIFLDDKPNDALAETRSTVGAGLKTRNCKGRMCSKSFGILFMCTIQLLLIRISRGIPNYMGPLLWPKKEPLGSGCCHVDAFLFAQDVDRNARPDAGRCFGSGWVWSHGVVWRWIDSLEPWQFSKTWVSFPPDSMIFQRCAGGPCGCLRLCWMVPANALWLITWLHMIFSI